MAKLKCSLKGEREKRPAEDHSKNISLKGSAHLASQHSACPHSMWHLIFLCSGYTKKTLETSHRGTGFSGNHPPDSFSSRTGASASQSFKVKAHSSQQRWPARGRPRLPAPASMERSGSHLLQQTSLRFQLRAARCQSSQSGPTRAL